MKPNIFLRNRIRALANLLRSLRRRGLDCIVLPIHGSYPERTARNDPLPFPFNRLPIGPSEDSLEDMRAIVDRIGGDRRVKTVILRFDTLQAGTAALYSLRRMLLDLRTRGKRLVAWLPTASTWDYVLASACDDVLLAPSGRLSVLGVRIEALFVKDTLALAGVEADLESIAEYKVTPDTFRRTTMTEPHREMYDGIAGSYFAEIVTAIAEGRGLDPEQVRETIDRMPLLPEEAVEAGLIDGTLYEDEIPSYLHPAGEKPTPPCTWRDGSRWLKKPIERTTRQAVGVVSVKGMIVPGHSRRSPIPLPLPVSGQAGAETIVQALRQARADKRIAAVILHVDSPGGSALASDLIAREVRLLREDKPVVALMGEQAASGGYYVAALAKRIVARPTTLTGSIGIWGGKFILGNLFARLGVHREPVQRGERTGLYSEMIPFSPEERAWVRRDMGTFYDRFKAIVAEGRGMTDAQVEEIARGRVWTGTQAREIRLVDEMGDFDLALALAKDLAGLDSGRKTPVVQVRPPRHELPPTPSPIEPQSWIALLEMLKSLAHERVWAMAPWVVQVR